jgi:hypothetical protein
LRDWVGSHVAAAAAVADTALPSTH